MCEKFRPVRMQMKAAYRLFCAMLLSAGAAHAQLAAPVLRDCAECPEMVVIPAGVLTTKAANEARQFQIASFAMAKYEVTQAEWLAIMGDAPSEFAGDQLPVETVSWRDVNAFIAKLNAKTGRLYRLPTSGEWEYAARANSSTKYFYGDDPALLDQAAWYLDNAAETTHPVGQKKPNAFGLYDVHGNVWEWTQDCTDDVATGSKRDETVAKFIRDCHRVYRGGSIANKPSSLTLTHTQSGGVGDRYFALGFRLVRSLP